MKYLFSILAFPLFLLAEISSPVAFTIPSPFYKSPACPPPTVEGVFFSTQFLYWKGEEEGLDLGNFQNAGFTGNNGVLEMDFDYHPAMRATFGLNLIHYWNIYLQYTRYHARESASTTSSHNNLYDPAPFGWFRETTSTATYIKGHLRLNIDIIDAIFSRTLAIDNCFLLEPFVCFRAARINQQFNVDLIVPSNPGTTAQSLNSSRSWNIGPRFGFNSEWDMGCGLFLSSQTAFSLLHGRYHLYHFDTSWSTGNTFTEARNKQQWVRPIFEQSLGLGWRWLFSNQWYLTAGIGYDFTAYFFQSILNAYMNALVNGYKYESVNLYTHGWNGLIKFEF